MSLAVFGSSYFKSHEKLIAMYSVPFSFPKSLKPATFGDKENMPKIQSRMTKLHSA